MTNPEDTIPVADEEYTDREADLVEDAERPIPLEAEPADALEQQLEVPDHGEDDYR
jgi:hypothetical protein